ncbi:MAG: DUF362 domain-containing protein [Candidatus Omnitrophica bacterium]|nr:DUF362 domain-containing protein [Candidatus Omnitrophota bacterium]
MADRSKIIFVGCPDYGEDNVSKAFERIEALAGINGIVLPERSKIVMKPNLLAPDPPEKATTTHPEIFRHTARLLKKRGNILFYGDSPGISSFEAAAKASGIAAVARAEDVTPLDFSKEKTVDFPEGRFCKKFLIADCLSQETRIMNLPKLKTHAQMTYTGAIKNIFGCVPGIRKPEFHLKMLSVDNFAMMIADLHIMLKPAFTIMDAVIGMDGNGPRGGTPRATGFIIAGADSLAIDSICARIIGLDPGAIPILKYSALFGIGNIDLEKIEVIGDDWRKFIVKDFKNIVTPASSDFISPKITAILKKFLITGPVVDRKKCILCMKCAKKCPVEGKAVSFRRGKIRYDYKRCIRCYCCQEICPEGAIYVKESVWWKILTVFYGRRKRTKI